MIIMNVSEMSYRQVILTLKGLNEIHERRERWNYDDKVLYGQICQRLNQYGKTEEEEE